MGPQCKSKTAHHALSGLFFAPGRGFALSRRGVGYAAHNTRARKRSKFARPYICRLMVFKRLTWPSTWPLLHGYSRDAITTAMDNGLTFVITAYTAKPGVNNGSPPITTTSRRRQSAPEVWLLPKND